MPLARLTTTAPPGICQCGEVGRAATATARRARRSRRRPSPAAGSLTARRDVRQRDGREVVEVAVLGVDRRGQLRPPGPQGDVVAGVGQDHREGGPPRAGAHHRDPCRRQASRPSGSAWPAGRTARAGGSLPRSSATSSVTASMIRVVASSSTAAVIGWRPQVVQRHRVAGHQPQGLAREAAAGSASACRT